jgi:hypothetical protein
MGLFSKKSSSRANSVTSDSFGKAGRKGSQTSVTSGSMSITGPRTSHNGFPLASIPAAVDIPPAPDAALDPSAYLRSIYAVRERSRFVLEAARKNQLTNFTVDMEKFSDVAEYVVSIIKVRENEAIARCGALLSLDRIEGLRAGLSQDSPAWQVAALRSRRRSSYRRNDEVMAHRYRQHRAYSTTA